MIEWDLDVPNITITALLLNHEAKKADDIGLSLVLEYLSTVSDSLLRVKARHIQVDLEKYKDLVCELFVLYICV